MSTSIAPKIKSNYNESLAKDILGKHSDSIEISIAGQGLVGDFKRFKTKSMGYYCSGKIVIDGRKAQVSVNVVFVGTRPA